MFAFKNFLFSLAGGLVGQSILLYTESFVFNSWSGHSLGLGFNLGSDHVLEATYPSFSRVSVSLSLSLLLFLFLNSIKSYGFTTN